MPKISLSETGICDILAEVYRPFEEVLSKVLDKPLSEVKQRRRKPKDLPEGLVEHWKEQRGRYDDRAAKFIPKAIAVLRDRKLLARHPDRGRLNSTLASTRLGWVIFPAYYLPVDFQESLNIEFGVQWWMTAAHRTDEVTWNTFTDLKTWSDLPPLDAGNVLEFIEAHWLLCNVEDFKAAMHRRDVAELVRRGSIEEWWVKDLAAQMPFWETLSGVLKDIDNHPNLYAMTLEERIAWKQHKNLPLDEAEKNFLSGKSPKAILQERVQREYDACPPEQRLAEAVARAKRGLWGWLRREVGISHNADVPLWSDASCKYPGDSRVVLEDTQQVARASEKPRPGGSVITAFTPEWYLRVAELTGLGEAKAAAAKTFLTTCNATELYSAMEELLTETEMEQTNLVDLNEPAAPDSIGAFVENLDETIPQLRARIIEYDAAFIADEEAAEALDGGDLLAAAGVPGRLL